MEIYNILTSPLYTTQQLNTATTTAHNNNNNNDIENLLEIVSDIDIELLAERISVQTNNSTIQNVTFVEQHYPIYNTNDDEDDEPNCNSINYNPSIYAKGSTALVGSILSISPTAKQKRRILLKRGLSFADDYGEMLAIIHSLEPGETSFQPPITNLKKPYFFSCSIM